jgi:hypothetical protein
MQYGENHQPEDDDEEEDLFNSGIRQASASPAVILCASCDRCRSRKAKCDGQRPCSNCSSRFTKKHGLARYEEGIFSYVKCGTFSLVSF